MASRKKTNANTALTVTPMSDDDDILINVGPRSAVVPTIGDNSSKIALLDSRVIHNWVAQAIHDNDQSAKLKGTATQRMAAAIIAQVSVWIETGHPDASIAGIPVLAQCNKSKDTRNEMMRLLRNAFFDVAPIAKGTEPDTVARIKMRRAAENTLLALSLRVACIIINGHMSLSSFLPDVGVFIVPKNMILPRDHFWTGYMNSPQAPDVIPLNGATYSCETMSPTTGKTVLVRVTATVQSLVRSAIPPKKRTPDAESSIDWKALPWDTAPTALLLHALHKALCETEGDMTEADEPLNNAFTQDEWNMFSDLAQWNDAEQRKAGFRKDALDMARADARS